jgi:hypothetical protein
MKALGARLRLFRGKSGLTGAVLAQRGPARGGGESEHGTARGDSEKAALIYQHSDEERQEEVAAGLDATVRKARAEAVKKKADKPSSTDLARGD